MQPSGPASDDGDVEGFHSPSAQRPRTSARPLALFVVGYNVTHHNGLLGSFETRSGTRVTDWIDLLTPFVVLLPLLWFLALQRARRREWIAAAIGSILYVEGHGIHLSANSINNIASSDTVTVRIADVIHLWDEVAGHYIWFLGLAIVLAVCALSVRGRPLHVSAGAMATGGAVTGITWATNGLEGGTAVFSMLCALAAMALADRRRSGLSVAFLAGGTVAVVVIAAFGISQGGFPQPSTL